MDRFEGEAYFARTRADDQQTTEALLVPMRAFRIPRGIETLAFRRERHVDNAMLVAKALRSDPRSARLEHASFVDNAYPALSLKYPRGRAAFLLNFGARAALEGAKATYDLLRLIDQVVKIGDAGTLCWRPAYATRRQMNAEELRCGGVMTETIRLSIGVEHVADNLEDLDQALASAGRACASLAAE